MKLNTRIVVALATTAASIVAVTGITPAQAANTKTLTIGAITNVKSWDPSQADIGHGIQYYQAAYDNLILRKPNGTYAPNLATSWTINAKSTEITLKLRTGVKFTDGAVFNADAAVANLKNFIGGNGPQAAALSGATATKVNATTVKLTLATPNPDIEYYLSTSDSFMASPNALGTDGLKTKPVGSGPYVYDNSSIPGSQLIFNANPNYWDKSKQKFTKIKFVFMDQVATRLNALRSGQIDATLLDVPNADTATGAGMQLTTYNTDWSGLILFDRSGKINPAMGDVRVRQAIAYAIDRAALLRTVQEGRGAVTGQIFSKASGAYDPSLDNTYAYNPTKAKSLLAAAGYSSGFTLQMPYNAFLEPLASFIETYLKAVKIKVDWVNAVDYRGEILSGKYAAGWYQLFQGTAFVNYNLAVAPDGARNLTKYTDSTIQAVDASISRDASSKNVIAQIKKANQHVVQEAWFVPFYTVPQMYFTNKKIKATPQAQNAVPYLYNYAPTGK
jgi:peptide/nickel transport system substrate-binding protein